VSELRILMVSAADDDQAALAALAALRAGAVGHIDKDVDPDTLERQVLRAAAGEAIVPRRLTMPLLALLQAPPDAGWRPLHSRLTNREWQIVDLTGRRRLDAADRRAPGARADDRLQPRQERAAQARRPLTSRRRRCRGAPPP
jgi:hypothetical protein